LVFNESIDANGEATITDLSTFLADTLDAYRQQCDIAKLQENQKLFIACGFCFNDARRMFRLFPQVFKIDTTCGSNSENRPLATVSIRTGLGTYMVAAYFFLPDEKRMTFRWLFQVAMPRLFGVDALHNVQCVISDGDAQETAEVDAAIVRFMPRAKRLQCAWHIINQGWKRVVAMPRSHHDEKIKLERLTFRRHLLQWLHFFTRPGKFETKEESDLSISILMSFVNSPEVLRVLNAEIVASVNKFLLNHVLVYEDVLFFHVEKSCVATTRQPILATRGQIRE
jgi:hypothetical protein